MNSIAIKKDDDTHLSDFQNADDLRVKAFEYLEQAENFYIETLKSFPEVCDYDLAHDRGKIDGMAWQTRQLKSYGSVFFSQAGQDFFVDDHIYKGKREGTFLEIGGYDGITNSNCMFFEMMRGWSGLLIEPSPQQIEKAKTVRQCDCVQAAIGKESSQQPFINITEGYTQLSGLAKTYSEEELKVARSHPHHKEEIINTPVMNLSELLADKELFHIDYCSFDIRGRELEILESFPFKDFDIKTWSIENNHKNTEIGKVMVQNGYTFMTVLGHDEVYHKL